MPPRQRRTLTCPRSNALRPDCRRIAASFCISRNPGGYWCESFGAKVPRFNDGVAKGRGRHAEIFVASAHAIERLQSLQRLRLVPVSFPLSSCLSRPGYGRRSV